MGPIRTRSLLLAAVVISSCITWTASRHHYTHNVSGHRSRHRRNGAGLYLPASYVLPGGEGSGAWGEWGEESPCSRTCGGGVASRKRICLEVNAEGQPACRGGDTKYFSCQTQDCPVGSMDFRAEQCAQHNSEPMRGIRYEWEPYTKGPNPCELNCMPRGERFYFRHATKVVDGTRCYDEDDSFDVCVDGVCQPVGCDMMLGSSAREDKCRQCRGNNTNCRVYQGSIPPETELVQGYNDVLLIPAGATSINIREVRNSNNYLALRSKTENKYYLNGNYRIAFPSRLLIAGARWHYERTQNGLAAPDKLRCQGPTNEPLYLSLLLLDQNVGIEYEYSLPTSVAPPPNQQYNWVHDTFTPCSATCGGGFQTRNVSCVSRDDLEPVDASLCDEGLKPPTNQTCSTQACAARWVEGRWSACDKPCGQGGKRSRTVHCEKVITNGYPSIVGDNECFELLGDKPKLFEVCNETDECPKWFTGPWKACDKLCGEGKQTREVVCFQKDDKGRIDVLEDESCDEEKPPTEKPCMLHPCAGVAWMTSDWKGCESCTSTVETRNSVCVSKDGTLFQVVNDTFCSEHQKPELEQPCDKSKLPTCEYQWYATQWSNCSVDCGKGVKTRAIFCGFYNGSTVSKVDEDKCNSEEKYNDTKPCEIPPDKCPAKWFAGPWTTCSEDCNDGTKHGEQYREVTCVIDGNKVDEKACDARTIPSLTNDCNMQACNDDELMAVPGHSTPKDYEEDYEEECEDYYDELEGGAEEEASVTPDDEMFSDSPATDGSGFSEITGTDITEGSGSEPTSLSTESSGSEPTEMTGTGLSESTGTTESSGTESSGTSDTSESSASTESSGTTSTGSTETVTTETGGSTSDETGTTETGTTETGTTGTGTTELGTTETGTTETGTTETGTTETGTTETGTTETGTTETGTTETGTTETGTTETGTTETGTTETGTTETWSTEIWSTVPSTTDTGSTETGSTETESIDTESTETGSTETGTTETGTTETGTTETGTTETGTTETGITETGTTETGTTETGTTETGTTEAGTTETGTTETGTTETGTTETGTTETGTTETGTTGTGSTETKSTGSETTETGSSGSTETGSTESTVSGLTESEGTGSTLEGSSTTESSEGSSSETTEWSWSSTVFDSSTKKCRRRVRKPNCKKTEFGCCPDHRSAAGGPFEEGCLRPTTCKESLHGCCPDGVSPATGPKNEGCPVIPCKETLFGCCKSDNKTPAQGNDQKDCPPPPPACKSSKYGCCKDGKTAATGKHKKGCPETEPEKPLEGCAGSKFGCCADDKTEATGPDGKGCPCNITELGCCPDGESPALGPQLEGCVMSCNTSAYGCCADGETPAHGHDNEGCCLLYPYGCCPDNYSPAEGPHLEGCSCQKTRYGCCPNSATIAKGPNNEGCGCKYTQFGCCPDRHTEATGPDYEGCGCHTYQFGCCPDGSTIAKGLGQQGCHCQQSKYGCCGDGQTAAVGPDQAGCDCSTSKYGCCPDGQTEAKGEKFLGCTDVPENRQAACGLPTARGPCRNYTAYWFYDTSYGGCSRFWYGGCEGNGNRFSSKEECDDVCVRPPPKDSCKLPKVKGACSGYNLRWYYDNDREQCSQFIYGGCLGNSNNFETREVCQKQCEPLRSENACQLPIDQGSCAGNFGRWGYNPETQKCEQFVWGGCEGNANRFSSEAACIMRCDAPGVLKPECSEPQEVGNCTEKVAVWSFSQTEDRCVPFYYTGCGGNGNRFENEQTCIEKCPSSFVQDLCTLPAATGECANYMEKWYYDTTVKRCQRFYYGGCGGNGNNFASERECEAKCKEETIAITTIAPATQAQEIFRKEYCLLPAERGPCNSPEARWAYDTARGVCAAFQYGGCGGNRNNFPSEQHCQYYCADAQATCQLPMLTGSCSESLTRYFYDSTTDSCSQFSYSGCDGNANNFESRLECERQCRSNRPTITTTSTAAPPVDEIPRECEVYPALEDCAGASVGEVWYYEKARRECVAHQNPSTGVYCRRIGVFRSEEACLRSCGAFRDLDVCSFAKDSGPCRENVPKFFFNSETGLCDQFTYGGCHGNANRFSTVEECEQVCIPETNPCKQPVQAGNCVGYEVKWYYDEVRDACGQFVYTGCFGNDNRFDTQAECESQCRRRLPPEPVTTTTQRSPPQPVDEVCRTPPSVEPCGQDVTVFYYDDTARRCTSVHGCNIPNTFSSEEECERRCGEFIGLDPCNTQLDPGPCRGEIPKVYWDSVTRSCESYTYGGCNGGPNRFSTVDECNSICGSADFDPSCLQKVDIGDPECLELAQRRWFFSQEHQACQVFVYSGCGGTDNNYISLEQCEALCLQDLLMPEPEPDNNVVVPDCSAYDAECRELPSSCTSGILRTRTAEGCELCSCAPGPDCSTYEAQCRDLESTCPSVQRTQTVVGCEHCICAVQINCESHRQQCQKYRDNPNECYFGINIITGPDGCERCTCNKHPCEEKTCPEGEKCTLNPYRDPVSQEVKYEPLCNTVNKPGSCPAESVLEPPPNGDCIRECYDDADCRGDGKCCGPDCAQRCMEPSRPNLPTARPSPPYNPAMPAAPQAIPQREPQVTSSEGGLATLRCLFHGNPPPKITWRRGEITIDGTVGRYRLLSDGALEIVSLYRNDTGVYICVADNELGQAQQEIYLQVNDPVEGQAGITGEPDAVVSGILGRGLSIRCLAYGYPEPAIYWYRGASGPMVPYSSEQYEARGNVLQIRVLTSQTVGEYTCQAYNGVGKPATWSVLVQAERPSRVVVTPYRPPIEPTTRQPEYVQPYQVPVSTRIQLQSSSVPPGGELSIPCEVDGYPIPDVYWSKDSNRLEPNDRILITESRLIIKNVITADSGLYGCHAQNYYSHHSSTLQIDVQGVFVPAQCTDNPFFADCKLIVRSKFCQHKYYSKFCCKSCVEAGQLDPSQISNDPQADQAWRVKK